MKLSIVGTGYVGLVTGTCFAEMGNDVLCIDIDADKVEALRKGEIPIYEPGLSSLVLSNSERGSLRFSTDVAEGVAHGEVIFIAVGTPEDEDGSADLKYVLNVARSIGEHMQHETVIIDKSTVPVGTADKVKATIAETLSKRGADIPFHVVSNPEFLKEGAAVADFMKPDRIIIGSDSSYAVEKMDLLYAPFNRNHDKVVHMDVRSAEMTKYAANVMLATRISLMNELANVADRLGADIEHVRRGIGMDPRIGYHFIYAGTGYGGSCFPKDVRALIHSATETDYSMHILESVDAVNDRQKRVLFDKLMRHFDGQIAGKTFAMWGLAFKPNTDDMREAPSRTLVELLTAAGANVRAYDPEAGAAAQRVFAGNEKFSISADKMSIIDGADGLLLVTEWNEFRSPDFRALQERLANAVIFDGRNLYEPDYVQQFGITHYGIGRGHEFPDA
ncbi:MAG: UDP-glucose/GDP-mannose dehydrogenase family protein [Pseudomonadota bacterium]